MQEIMRFIPPDRLDAMYYVANPIHLRPYSAPASRLGG